MKQVGGARSGQVPPSGPAMVSAPFNPYVFKRKSQFGDAGEPHSAVIRPAFCTEVLTASPAGTSYIPHAVLPNSGSLGSR